MEHSLSITHRKQIQTCSYMGTVTPTQDTCATQIHSDSVQAKPPEYRTSED